MDQSISMDAVLTDSTLAVTYCNEVVGEFTQISRDVAGWIITEFFCYHEQRREPAGANCGINTTYKGKKDGLWTSLTNYMSTCISEYIEGKCCDHKYYNGYSCYMSSRSEFPDVTDPNVRKVSIQEWYHSNGVLNSYSVENHLINDNYCCHTTTWHSNGQKAEEYHTLNARIRGEFWTYNRKGEAKDLIVYNYHPRRARRISRHLRNHSPEYYKRRRQRKSEKNSGLSASLSA